jgi:hypothetical protein
MIISYRRVIVCVLAVAMLVVMMSGIEAQQASAPKDEVRLLFEISESGRVVAKPSVLLLVGEVAKLSFDPVSFSIVPTRTDGNVSLLLEFMDGTKASIRIDRAAGGSLSLGERNKFAVKIALGQ